MLTQRQVARPKRGRGHYSADRRRWWDEGQQQWFRVGPTQDSLEIQLEDSGGESFIGGILTTLGSQGGSGYYRFVGVARSDDHRWPVYRVPGDTFPAPRELLSDIPPQQEWAPGMTRCLLNLQAELLAEGWLPAGNGAHPWSGRYTRPCFESASRIPSPRGPADS